MAIRNEIIIIFFACHIASITDNIEHFCQQSHKIVTLPFGFCWISKICCSTAGDSVHFGGCYCAVWGFVFTSGGLDCCGGFVSVFLMVV